MKEALKTAMLVSKAGNAFFQVGAGYNGWVVCVGRRVGASLGQLLLACCAWIGASVCRIGRLRIALTGCLACCAWLGLPG